MSRITRTETADLLARVENVDESPRVNASILREIEAVSDELAGLVQDYREIRSDGYGPDEDDRDAFHADKEEAWDAIYLVLQDAAVDVNGDIYRGTLDVSGAAGGHDGDPWAEECSRCGHRADWHDETTMACPDEDYPHPDSIAVSDIEDQFERAALRGSAAEKCARDAANVAIAAFTYDVDGEDAESCASRAADLFHDAAPDDVARLAVRVFGNGDDLKVCEREYRRAIRTADNRDAVSRARAEVIAARGIPEVAYVLCQLHPTTIAATVLQCHADDVNRSHWDDGQKALEAVRNLGEYAYGGGPFDMSSRGPDAFEILRTAAIAHCVDAAKWSAVNALAEYESRASS